MTAAIHETEATAVLTCFAVKEEAAPFQRICGDTQAEVLITGMGSRNAGEAVRRCLDKGHPSLVLTCGFAGALDPKLKIGDVLFDADPAAHVDDTLRSLGAIAARFHCAPRVAVSVAEKAGLRHSTGADAVEMESGVIRTICRERGIPSATVRVISDTANEDLPLDFNKLLTTDQKVSMSKLAGALLKSPGSIPRLIKLQRNTRIAAQRLADVLHGLLRTLRNSG